jgi:hypothetical protein
LALATSQSAVKSDNYMQALERGKECRAPHCALMLKFLFVIPIIITRVFGSTLQSVLNQTFEDIEVIYLDDARRQ